MEKDPAKLNIITIIPARGGSKRVVNKNIISLAGLPLLAYSILQARNSKHVNRVFVSTEDQEIAKVASDYQAEVILRPDELASDQATSESALSHVLDSLKAKGEPEPGLVVFLQCTSPVRRADDIDNAIEKLLQSNADSLFSAYPDKGLMWLGNGQEVRSINYDYQNRRREQEMGQQYRENGSIYVFKPEILRKHNNRLGGKIDVYEMDLLSSFQVDEPNDLDFIESILHLAKPKMTLKTLDRIELVAFDFDGVFTDNKVVSYADGNETVLTSRADSLGLNFLRQAGIPAMVLSTEKHPVVAARCQKLQLLCHQGVDNKKHYLEKYLLDNNIDPKNVVYVGNDLNDLECFGFVGFPIAVADSDPKIILEASYVLSRKGGQGAVREVCDLIINSLKK